MKQKFNKRRWVAAAIAASSLALLTGCGQNGNNNVVPPPGVGAPGLIGGGCVPINSTTMIPFTVTGMYIGSESARDMRVLAGTIPPVDKLAPGTYGIVSLNNGGMIQPQGYNLATLQGRRVDGTTISLSVSAANGAVAPQQYPQGGYPQQYPTMGTSPTGQYNATGHIQVSPFIQQMLIQTATGSSGYGISQPILNQYPGQYPTQYPGQYPNGGQICVSNVAISLQRTLSSNYQYPNWLYMGQVYFYLSGGATGSNGQHGLAINF